MPRYTITARDNTPASELETAKQHAIDKGKLVAELFTLKGGFIVDYPDQIKAAEVHSNLHVEQDHTFKTQ
ncbi:hypothetical protein BO94DRAFT_623492 [Aspergillus sclerotioniger CBS 115572]|uniref:Inhibitor I9 domain-containing protein n=1 Tax=Aspergillus sclerotioniger CBS 115572 TaxID=1450535 RepID=A0A317WZ37_9EURO|nr:hypothetical protein BO94DRAFT_623492 [Aspergillus sclerotioniger CBS 115572]PWY89490.1 hypothetical protein BO94DRAFT_623492 [Aspergillus sclerotioniger CBS 115572]